MIFITGQNVLNFREISNDSLVTEGEDQIEIALEMPDEYHYRQLVIADHDGKKIIVGAILLGYPSEASATPDAVRDQLDVSSHLDVLRMGDWRALMDEE